MDYSRAIANHFYSKIRTLSTRELTGIDNPKVFIAFCSFASKEYMFIKNYTSKPIMIGESYMAGKTLCCEINPIYINVIKTSPVKVSEPFDLPDFVDSLIASSANNIQFRKIEPQHLAIVSDYSVRPKTYKMSYSDIEEYLYKYDISDYKRHFSNNDGNGSVTMTYTTSSNTLISSKVIGDYLYCSDAIAFEKYMVKMIHSVMYSGDNSYKNRCDQAIFKIKGLMHILDAKNLETIANMMEEM